MSQSQFDEAVGSCRYPEHRLSVVLDHRCSEPAGEPNAVHRSCTLAMNSRLGGRTLDTGSLSFNLSFDDRSARRTDYLLPERVVIEMGEGLTERVPGSLGESMGVGDWDPIYRVKGFSDALNRRIDSKRFDALSSPPLSYEGSA